MDVRSLTQTEAEERAALLEVERYDVEVDLTDLPDRARGAVRLDGGVHVPRAGRGDVRRLRRRGRPARPSTATPLDPPVEGRIALPGLAEHNTLVVESVQAGHHGRPRGAQGGRPGRRRGLPVDVLRARRGAVRLGVLRPARPEGPARASPSRRRPRGRCSATAVTRRSWTRSRTRRRWSFPTTPPLSTYNPVVNAGPFHEIRREAGGYDLGIFARRSLASVLERDADELFTVTEQGLAFFAERVRDAVPAAQVRPGVHAGASAARWRTTAA